MKQEMNYGNCFKIRHSASPCNFDWEGMGVQKLSGTYQLFVECGAKVLSENI